MILQALYDYYQRKADDPESGIAPEGWEVREIKYLIVIDEKGKFRAIESTQEGEGRTRRFKKFLVPQGEKRTTGVKAYLLWDNIEYALGANPRNRNDIKIRHEEFRKRIKADTGGLFSHPSIQAVVKFLDSSPIEQIEANIGSKDIWKDVLENNSFVAFRVDGSEYSTVCEVLFKEGKSKDSEAKSSDGRCLVTGDIVNVSRLHPSIKGVRGTNTSGASIVSFNLPAFGSYGKSQNYNAPIGEGATFAYTTALNNLLGRDSANKVLIGDTTVVFWAQKQSEVYDLESNFSLFFSWYSPTKEDNTDKGIKAVQNLYNAFHTGILPRGEKDRFYVLGLAPNAARISVRFWKTGTVKDFAEKIIQHFKDFEIVHGPKEPEHLALTQILSATAFEYKMDNVPPNLAGAVMVSILDGSPYPQTLLQQCVRRIRAEQQVNRARAAILKAHINRFNRFHNQTKKEISMAIDFENKDLGYLLGRLFAILERVQIQSAGGEGRLNTTIRDRFYGAFSSSPITVMPILLKLKNHHIAKLKSGKVFFEGLIGQVFDGINAQKIPAHLTLEYQAHFAVGYYHQRQDFYKKKDMVNQ